MSVEKSYREKVVLLLALFFGFFPYKFRRLMKFSFDASLGYGTGGFDIKNEVETISKLLSDRSEITCFDIGANKGEWASGILGVYPNAKVLCFEPDLKSIKVFENLLKEFPNLALHNIAISDYEGVASLHTLTDLWGGASLLPQVSLNAGYSKDVQVDTLDNFVLKSGIQPDVIKIDVEGAEMSVLKGASHTLKSVTLVEFEFSDLQMYSKLYFKDYFQFFNELGFELGRITPSGFARIAKYDPVEEFFRTTNYIAYRKSALKDK